MEKYISPKFKALLDKAKRDHPEETSVYSNALLFCESEETNQRGQHESTDKQKTNEKL